MTNHHKRLNYHASIDMGIDIFCHRRKSLYVNQNQLDEFVESEIKEMFLTDKGKQKILSIIQNKYLKGVAHLETMINSTEENLKTVESQIARITNDYVHGIIDPKDL